MRNLLLVSVMLLCTAAVAVGQKKIAAVKPAAKTPDYSAFTRERFDPTRDPAPDLAAAIETAKRTGKHIILDVGGEWCGWCVFMDKYFFLNPKLTKIRDDNFVWIKVNFSEENENKAFLAPYPVPDGYPHLYVLDAGGKLIQSQDTASLEAGNTYDIVKFTRFLKKWSPAAAPGGRSVVR